MPLGIGLKSKISTFWTPASLGSALVGWYKPENLSLGSITTWADSSGHGNNLLVGGVSPTGVSGPSGHIVADFSLASGAQLKGGAFTLSQPFEVFAAVACYNATNAANGYMLDFQPGNTCTTQQFGTASGGGTRQISQYNGAFLAGPNFPAVNTVFVVDSIFNGSSSSLSVNAGTPVTGSPGGGGTGAGLSVGDYYAGGSFSLQGWVGEVLICSSSLSSGQRTLVQNYFQSRWGQP